MNRILRSLNNMAEFDLNSRSGEAKYSIYVLDVIPLSENCKYQIYVEERFAEHREGGSKAARIFRSMAAVGDIRWDLMNGFPKFYSREAAERAEGRVAKWLSNKGLIVRCNMLEKE
jgi:hypothetical protein